MQYQRLIEAVTKWGGVRLSSDWPCIWHSQKCNKLLDDLPKLVVAPVNHELSNGNYGGNVKFDYQQKLSKTSFHSSFPVKYPFLVNEGFSGTLLIMLLDTNNPNGLAEALNRVKKLDLSEHEGLVIISHYVTDPDMADYAHSIPEHFCSRMRYSKETISWTF